MTEVFFHCSDDAEHVLIDRRGAAMGLAEARRHAEHLVYSLLTKPGADDWRTWVLHVTDEFGEEIFALPFASVLGKPH
jgi:hypothetical protein